MRATLLALGLLVVVGCASRPATQILVEVDAESGVRSDLDVVHVIVNGGDGATVGAPGIQRLDLRERPPRWPFTLVIAPLDRDAERRYEVVITAEGAQPGAGARPVVARVRAISGFVPGETRVLRLLLEDACRGVSCSDDQTCRLGVCESATLDPDMLPPEARPDAGRTNDSGSGAEAVPRNLPPTVWSDATGSVVVMTSASIDTDSGVVLVDGRSSRDFTPIEIEPVGDCAGIFAIATGELRVAEGATVSVTGTRALAVAATGAIVVAGRIDVGGRGTVPGPGGLRRRAGGSYGSAGGFTGMCSPPAGVLPTYGDTLLTGLCGGSTDDVVGAGGAGGAIELASLDRIDVTETGVLRAGGGGGTAASGGSGGGILLIAPAVRVAGNVSVNGGGGGGQSGTGPTTGADASSGAMQASGAPSTSYPTCTACGQSTIYASGGAGAWQAGPATSGTPGQGCTCTGTNPCNPGGGGGGGAGRIRIEATTRDYVEGRVLEYSGLPGVFTDGPL